MRTLGWMWVAGIALGFAGAHAANTEPFVRSSFDADPGVMSFIFSAGRIGSLAAILLTTRGDRTRPRAFRVAYLAAIGTVTLTAAVPSLTWYAAMTVLTRLAVSASVIVGTVIIVESVSATRRPYAVSLFGAALSLGAGASTAGLAVAEWAERTMSADGWRVLYATTAVFVLVVPGLAGGLVETSPVALAKGWFAAMNERPAFWRLAASSFAFGVFSGPSGAFVIEHLVVDLDLSATRAAQVALIGGTIGGLGFWLGGWLANTLGRHRTAIVGFVFATAGGIGVYAASDPLSAGTFIALSAFGAFTLVPSFGVLRNEAFDVSYRTRAVTWINNAGVTGAIAGFAIGGILIDRLGIATTVAWLGISAGVAIISLIGLPQSPVEHTKQPVGPIGQ